MKRERNLSLSTTGSLVILWLIALSGSTLAGSPPTDAPSGKASSPKDEILDRFFRDCAGKPVKDANCDKLRSDAVDILKENLHTLRFDR